MDVLYFLKSRARFIRKFHQEAGSNFEEKKRKIKDSDPPFEEPPESFNSDQDEPPFLNEYIVRPCCGRA